MKPSISISAFLFAFCLVGPAQGQAYDFFHPMLRDGKVWQTDAVGHFWNGDTVRHYVHYIEGDTIIHGMTWKKVYSNQHAYPDHVRADTAYFAAIREEGARVYGIFREHDAERLLYDFSLKVGDHLFCSSESERLFDYVKTEPPTQDEPHYWTHMHLTGIDTVEVSGCRLRRFIFTSDYMLRAPSSHKAGSTFVYPVMTWVEGVGSEGGLFLSWSEHSPESLVSCGQDAAVLFSDMDFHGPDVSQVVRNIPHYYPPGTTWVQSYDDPLSGAAGIELCRYAVTGTKNIDGYEYHTVERTHPYGDVDLEPYYIREADEKVYIYSEALLSEVLMYDFVWTDGKPVALTDYHSGSYIHYSPSASGITQLADGNRYETIDGPYSLIRTIGKTRGAGLFSITPNQPADGRNYYISSFSRNGVELIAAPSGIRAPHIVPVGESPRQLFDLTGRRLAAPPARGLYIEDGRIRRCGM